MPIINDPCFFLEGDHNRLTKLLLKENTQPNWNAVERNQSLQQVTILRHFQESQDSSSHQHLLKLSLAIRSQPQLATIQFDQCALDDLGPLCVAIAPKQQPAAFEFTSCTLSDRAAQTLRIMLETDKIEKLSFHNCLFSEEANEYIAEGLSRNLSLRSFQCTHDDTNTNSNLMMQSLSNSVHELVRGNGNVLELSLTLKESEIHWELCRSVEIMNTLERLQILYSPVNLPAMEALMSICMSVTTFKELELSHCSVDEMAMEYMVRTLSRVQVIDTLILDSNDEGVLELDFGGLLVERLILKGNEFEFDCLNYTLDSIADNPCIKCLELGAPVLTNPRAFRKFCNYFLRGNRGPPELFLDDINDKIDMLTDAMQVNTRVKALTINDLDSSGLVTFAQGLAQMTGLRKLTIQSKVTYSVEFFQALQQSLEQNSTLCTLSMDTIDADFAVAKQYLPRIRYLLAINRVGRRQLLTATTAVPPGLWPLALECSSNVCDGIYFALTGKPDLVSPSRKRKNQIEHYDHTFNTKRS